MQYEYVADSGHLLSFCEQIADADTIVFDTEFISERTYRPELSLIQVAANGHVALIDPLAIDDITPFWELIAEPGHTTVVHSGREEFRFCLAAVNRRPAGWFDTQIAAALIGLEYPAAYSTLASKLLKQTVPKGETRTDWKKRPLSEQQLDYALRDVLYLEPLRDHLMSKIKRLKREDWLQQEMDAWQQNVELSESEAQWHRVSGISGLSSRSLAIVRELWIWRNQEAKERNRPAKHILRDDLMVELARRKSANMKHIKAIRGLERAGVKRHLPILAERIQAALDLPDEDCPKTLSRRGGNSPQFHVLGQFLNSALTCICRSSELAPTLVGTVQDVRDYVAYRLANQNGKAEVPNLCRGWRAEVVGRQLDDLLKGRLSLSVRDPYAEQPLQFRQAPVQKK